MLEGTLESFALPEILQLLSLTGKTGCLQLRRDADRGRIWLRDGQVHYADASVGRLALGKRLIGAGLVTTEQLQTALDAQERLSGVRIGQLLVESGAVDTATLETFVREQIQDAVFDLMRWTDGSFSFAPAEEREESIGLAVSAENLVMEGSRRLEEWDAVQRKIPARSAVVAVAPAPGDRPLELNLTADEWRLLTLVDGRRNVGELVELMGRGEFVTTKLLYGMVVAGLLEVRDPQVHGPPSIAVLLEQFELLEQLESELVAPSPEAAAPPPLRRDDSIDVVLVDRLIAGVRART